MVPDKTIDLIRMLRYTRTTTTWYLPGQQIYWTLLCAADTSHFYNQFESPLLIVPGFLIIGTLFKQNTLNFTCTILLLALR
jgi:hypothetical protein